MDIRTTGGFRYDFSISCRCVHIDGVVEAFAATVWAGMCTGMCIAWNGLDRVVEEKAVQHGFLESYKIKNQFKSFLFIYSSID